MALTKLPKNAIADDAVNADKIADGTIQNQDVQGSISNDKLANSSFTLNGTEVSLGGSTSIVPYLDWQAVQVADGSTQVTAEVGKGYFLDTNAGVIEVFLPSSPTRGDVVGLVDYAGTFGTNQLIINTGGVNIDSTVGSEFKVTTNNAIVECVYVDSAKGWMIYLNQAAGTTPSGVLNAFGGYDTLPANYPFITATGGTVTTSGDYKIHSFTGDGCFVVQWAGLSPAPSVVDYLVVAGGGGGGHYALGGGGAGGFRLGSADPGVSTPLSTCGITLTTTTYPITVGGGGTGGGPAPLGGTPAGGQQGSPSVFSTITSTGGGGGGNFPSGPGPVATDGSAGGSGGAIGRDAYLGGRTTAGNGNTPPVSPSQGNPGGVHVYPSNAYGSRGGGGAGGAGSPGGPTEPGGNSAPVTAIFGCAPQPFYTGSPANGSFAGGGGGATFQGNSANGGGSTGGTADAISDNPSTNAGGGAGQTNTGGGGGSEGPGTRLGGAGGKGIVLIRYKFQ